MPTHVVYARKSSESEDRQVLSIDSQVQELRLLAARRALAPLEIVTEAHSAKAPGRPEFERLMKRIEHGEVGSVLCWKMDRLARNHLDHGRVLQALADGKLATVVTPERTYTADGNDRFLGNFELGMATKYIDDLRANVKRGNRARFQRGWPNFRPPAGYLEDHETKTVVKDPVRFPLIRRAWDLILAGSHRPSQVLRLLNDEWGFRTRKTKRLGGNPLGWSGFYRILGDPFYMGLIRLSNGETYKGAHEAMLSPAEFERAQERLGRSARPRPSRHEFALSGVLLCASCGRAMIGEVHTKPSGKRYVYYRCQTHRLPVRCGEPPLPESSFEALFIADLARMCPTPKAAAWIRKAVAASIGPELETLAAGRKSLDTAIAQTRSEEETLLNLRLRGAIDDGMFDRRRKDLGQRRARLELKIAQPRESPNALLTRLDRAIEFSACAVEGFRSGDPVLRRQIVEAVGSNYRARGRKVHYTANNPFRAFTSTRDSSLWWTVAEDVRTWLLNSEGFWLPDLNDSAGCRELLAA